MTEQGEIKKLEQNIIKTIYLEIFSNPFKSGYGFIKRLSAYMKLCFLQFRRPTFLLDGVLELEDKKNESKPEKFEKNYLRGYIAYIREGISILAFAVLLQLAFDEITSKETTGNLAIAGWNALLLVGFFISLMVFAGVGMFMTRKVENEKNKKKLQETFVYECSMIFGFTVLLMLMKTFGIVSVGPVSNSLLQQVVFLLVPFQVFYFLISINHRVKITNIIGIVFFGLILSMTGWFLIIISLIFAMEQAGMVKTV